MGAFFSKNNRSDDSANSPESALSIISPGTVIEGNIFAQGDIRVEGKIIGTLVCKSRLVISSQGVVEGNIDTLKATVAGTINGNLIARELLQVLEAGRITGDVCADKIVTSPGSVINGNLKTGDLAIQAIKNLPQLESSAKKEPTLLNSVKVESVNKVKSYE